MNQEQLKVIAQWLLHDSGLGEAHLALLTRLSRERKSWDLTEDGLYALANLVSLLDLQHMLYRSHNVPLPKNLVDRARGYLDSVWDDSNRRGTIWRLETASVNSKLDWDPNEKWTGTPIEWYASGYSLLGALWIMADFGDSISDLERVERVIELFRRFQTKGSPFSWADLETREQHAAIMARRKLSERLFDLPATIDDSMLYQRFVSRFFKGKSAPAETYDRLFRSNLEHYYPFRQDDSFHETLVEEYVKFVAGLEDRSFYLERLHAFGLLQGRADIDPWSGLSECLKRDFLGYFQPDDYWLFLLAARENQTLIGEAIVATHLAIRHLHGEQLIEAKHFPIVVERARRRVADYVNTGRGESDLLEEPIILAAFGEPSDVSLLDRYLTKADETFQFELTRILWGNNKSRHMESTLKAEITKFQSVMDGNSISFGELLSRAMKGRFE